MTQRGCAQKKAVCNTDVRNKARLLCHPADLANASLPKRTRHEEVSTDNIRNQQTKQLLDNNYKKQILGKIGSSDLANLTQPYLPTLTYSTVTLKKEITFVITSLANLTKQF